MVVIKAIRWVSDKIQILFLDISAAMMLVLTLAMFYSVVMRYIFNNSPTWSDEVCRYLYVWVQMLGTAIVTRQMTHTAVTFLSDRYKGNLKKIYQLVYNLCFLAIGYLMLTIGISFVKLSGNVQMGALAPLKMYLVYVSLPIAGGVMMLQTIRNIADWCLARKNHEGVAEIRSEGIE